MNNESTKSDQAILTELGQAIAKERLNINMTQIELANEAGVSKATVQRMEDGKSTQVTNLIRILRALNLIDDFLNFLPQIPIRPLEAVNKKVKQRASKTIRTDPWSWGNEDD